MTIREFMRSLKPVAKPDLLDWLEGQKHKNFRNRGKAPHLSVFYDYGDMSIRIVYGNSLAMQHHNIRFEMLEQSTMGWRFQMTEILRMLRKNVKNELRKKMILLPPRDDNEFRPIPKNTSIRNSLPSEYRNFHYQRTPNGYPPKSGLPPAPPPEPEKPKIYVPKRKRSL